MAAKRVHRHYERVIVACCFAIFFVNVGIASSSFNIFQTYIAALPGIGDSGASMILATRTLVSLICMLFVNRYVHALGARFGAALAAFLVVIGFFFYSIAHSMTGFMLGAVFAGAGYGLGGLVVITLVTHNWFARDVGTATGIATTGSGVSSVLLAPVVVRVIENHSLAWGFRFEGAIALLIAVLLLVFLRDEPADLGMKPFGLVVPETSDAAPGQTDAQAVQEGAPALAGEVQAGEVQGEALSAGSTEAAPTPAGAASGFSPAAHIAAARQGSAAERAAASAQMASHAHHHVQAAHLKRSAHASASHNLPRPALIALAFACALIGCCASDGSSYFPILFASEGIDALRVATLASVLGISMIVGKLVGGAIMDRVGTLSGSLILFTLMATGFFFACLGAKNHLYPFIAVMCFGAGASVSTVGMSLWAMELSTEASLPATIKNLQVGYAIGMFLFSMVPGPLKEAQGTYVISFQILFVMAIVSALVFIWVYIRHHDRDPQEQEIGLSAVKNAAE